MNIFLACLKPFVTPTQDGSEVTFKEAAEPAVGSTSGGASGATPSASAPLVAKTWCGKFAIPSTEFSPETVGAKSLNSAKLQVRHIDH